MENCRITETCGARAWRIFAACLVAFGGAAGILFLRLWPGDVLFWRISTLVGGAFFLVLLLLWRKLPTTLLPKAGGLVLVLWGVGLILNFSDILYCSFGVLSVALALIGSGTAMVVEGGGVMRRPFVAATMSTFFLSGLIGWADRAIVANGGITGVYDPVEKDRGVFFVAEPCFLVFEGDKGVSIVSGGHGGVFPEYAKPSDVGKRVGPYRIIGVVEKGAEIQVYEIGGRRMAVLDFSLVSPRGEGQEEGAVVIESPI